MQVFLCHSSADKAVVVDVYHWLVGFGFQPWLDAANLIPGQDWAYEIQRAINASGVVVVFLSNESVGRTGFVQREIRFALDAADERPEGTTFVIPARLEPCPIPSRLSRWHWVDLFEPDGYGKLLRALQTARGFSSWDGASIMDIERLAPLMWMALGF